MCGRLWQGLARQRQYRKIEKQRWFTRIYLNNYAVWIHIRCLFFVTCSSPRIYPVPQPCGDLRYHLWCAGWQNDPRLERNPSTPWVWARLRSSAMRFVNCRTLPRAAFDALWLSGYTVKSCKQNLQIASNMFCFFMNMFINLSEIHEV